MKILGLLVFLSPWNFSKKNYLNDSARSDGAAGCRRDEAEREDVRVGGEHGAAARPEEGG